MPPNHNGSSAFLKLCTFLIFNFTSYIQISFRRLKILTILATKFCEISTLQYIQTKVRWRFRKILWPSQNIWTLKLCTFLIFNFTSYIQVSFRRFKILTILTIFSQIECTQVILNEIDTLFHQFSQHMTLIYLSGCTPFLHNFL